MTQSTWQPEFKMWPTFELKPPALHSEAITPAELHKRVKRANRQHELDLVAMALATILGNYRCEIRDEDETYPCNSPEDFYLLDEHYVHCFSPHTGEELGWFLFIPNNGSPAECFCDWGAGDKQFGQFLEGVMEAFDE